MDFKIERAVAYDGSFPSFRYPTEIGFFSLNSERKFCSDKHQHKYLYLPPDKAKLYMDLNILYNESVKKNFGKTEKIDTLLKGISSHQKEVKKSFKDQNHDKTRIDFICFRGLLTTICTTIYENKDDWLICATKYKSAIYLCAFDTDQDLERREKMTERDKLMSSWGYKFEQYMTSDSKTSRPVTSVPVNEKEEFCIILKGRLQDHTLLYSAEVDGEDPSYRLHPGKDPKSTERYMELKTSRIITSERQDRNFCRFKLLKWWAQSFLVGIPKIICGFRDDNGIVQYLRIFHVRDIPRMAQSFWSPAACLNFCSHFLDHIKKCVIKDDPHCVYKFYWRPGQDTIFCEELTSPSDYQILPEWYITDVEI